MEVQQTQPRYKLIQYNPGPAPCPEHEAQDLAELYNTPTMKMEVVDIDKIKFNCVICHAEKVYKMLAEKVLLNTK